MPTSLNDARRLDRFRIAAIFLVTIMCPHPLTPMIHFAHRHSVAKLEEIEDAVLALWVRRLMP